MRFRKLRIAFTAFCGLAAVLLVAFWVRSYQPASSPKATFSPGYSTTYLDSEKRLWYFASTEGAAIISVTRQNDPSVRWDGTIVPGGWLTYGAEPQLCGFGMLKKERSFSITFPAWSVVTLSVMATIVPWVYQPKWRFSIRTMLICVTALAVVLGLAVWAAGS